MSGEKVHHASQAGALCGAGWGVPQRFELDEITCADCLRRYKSDLRARLIEVRERLFAIDAADADPQAPPAGDDS